MEFKTAAIDQFLNMCTPLHAGEARAFERVKARLNGPCQVVFYPCSGIDVKPVILMESSDFRQRVGDHSQPARVYLCADTAPVLPDVLYRIYNQLSEVNESGRHLSSRLFTDYTRNYVYWVDDLILLRHFPQDYIENTLLADIDAYIGRENFGNVGCSSFPGIDAWNQWVHPELHCAYMHFSMVDGAKADVFIFPCDNIVVWKEIIEKFSLPVSYMTVFDEGSGGWDWQCRPGAPLFNVIANTPMPSLRPVVWTDNRHHRLLPQEWPLLVSQERYQTRMSCYYGLDRGRVELPEIHAYEALWNTKPTGV